MDDNLKAALAEYIGRRDRMRHPKGRYDGKRWEMDESERRDCCRGIRAPSRKWPWSEMVHCRTAKHVALLYGVSASELKRAARTAG